MDNSAAGVLIMLLSTTMMNIGMVVQKRAVDRMPPLEQQGVGGALALIFRSPLWLVGWIMTTSAIVLNMVALGLADISLIQPLNGFGMVVLVVFSRLYLKEQVTNRMAWGIGAALIGVVLIGLTAKPSREFTGIDEILVCYRQPSAVVALGVFVVAIVGLWRVALGRGRRAAGVLIAFVAACSSVVGLTFSKGLFGMFATAGVGPTLSVWPAYVLLVLGLSFAIMALLLQQLSFQKGRAVVVTPVFSANSVLLPLAMGLFVFDEAVGPAVLLPLALIVIGVVLLGGRATAVQPAGVQGA